MDVYTTQVIICSMFIFVSVYAKDYYEDRHKYQIATQMEHLKEIPRRFEVKGENAMVEFKKYVHSVQDMARKENVTVAYRIKAEVYIPKSKFIKKDLLKRIKTKKYNVPLKKQNMKLSNFEMTLRKRANEHQILRMNYMEEPVTTQRQQVILSTRPASSGKYKPIIGHVKTNYTKIVRPVRNKVITLFV